MSKKIEVKVERSLFVTACYNEYSDEFNFSLQTWEPGDTSDSFVIKEIPFLHEEDVTRGELVRRQLGKLDTKEEGLRTEFNTDIMAVGEIRQKLLALTYDEQEHEAALVNDLGPAGKLSARWEDDDNNNNSDITF